MEATSLPRGRTLTLPRGVLARLDDERLVAALRRGNVGAFEVIYDRHHRGILAYARHLLGSQEEAEDAVQQTFASAHTALIGDERDIKLKAWLYAIARNRCLSVLRARREQPAELDDISTAGLTEEVQRRDDLRALLADLQDLPEPQRAALVLASVSGLGHAEIARILECDVAKVKSLVFQARSGLIERRQARETPCAEIREQLSVLTGGSLRRGPLRRHLRACPGCAAYREQVKRQRQMLAVALPVIPTLGLKESALAAAFGAAGAAGGGAAAAGGLAGAAISAGAKTGLAKMAAVVVAGGAAVGGGTYAVTTDHVPALGGDRPPAERADSAPASGGPPAAPAAAPAFDERRSGESSRERAARRKAARKRLQARRRALRERREQRRRGRDERRGGDGLRGRDELRDRDGRRGRGRRGRDESRGRDREQDESRVRGDSRGRDGGRERRREEAERRERSEGRSRSQRRRRTQERPSRERAREPAQQAPERDAVRRGTRR